MEEIMKETAEQYNYKKEIAMEFEINLKDLDNCEILISNFNYDYDSEVFILFRKGKKLYEVNGSHCSCYGYENQWLPELVTKEALLHRADKKAEFKRYSQYSYEYVFPTKNEIMEVLK